MRQKREPKLMSSLKDISLCVVFYSHKVVSIRQLFKLLKEKKIEAS